MSVLSFLILCIINIKIVRKYDQCQVFDFNKITQRLEQSFKMCSGRFKRFRETKTHHRALSTISPSIREHFPTFRATMFRGQFSRETPSSSRPQPRFITEQRVIDFWQLKFRSSFCRSALYRRAIGYSFELLNCRASQCADRRDCLMFQSL